MIRYAQAQTVARYGGMQIITGQELAEHETKAGQFERIKMKNITFKQWLKHLSSWWFWVKGFPFPWQDKYDLHSYHGLVNSGENTCLICGDEYYDPSDIVYRCPKCVSPILFEVGNTWVCSSENCGATGSIQELVGDNEADLAEVLARI